MYFLYLLNLFSYNEVFNNFLRTILRLILEKRVKGEKEMDQRFEEKRNYETGGRRRNYNGK